MKVLWMLIFPLNMFKTRGLQYHINIRAPNQKLVEVKPSLFHPSFMLGQSTVFFPRGLISGFHQGGLALASFFFLFLFSSLPFPSACV
jgi:hypothetical protein